MLFLHRMFTVAALAAAFGPALVVAQDASPLMAENDQAKLIAVLKSDAPVFDKAMACKRLAMIGDQEVVPALAALLADEQLSHYARFALEPNPHAAAGAALRTALTSAKGRLRIGIIGSLGKRKDTEAVGALSKLLADTDAETVGAAAAALAHIGTVEAAAAVGQMLGTAPAGARSAVVDASMVAAERLLAQDKGPQAAELFDRLRKMDLSKHLVVAATRGAILARKTGGIPLLMETLQSPDVALFGVALRTARELPGDEVTQALLGQLDKFAPARQALVLAVLGDRQAAGALPAVRKLAANSPAEIRVTAIRVLAQLADATSAGVLLAALNATEPEVAEAAKVALQKLPGKQVDEAVAAALAQSTGKSRVVLLELAGSRRIAATLPILMRAADDAEAEVRYAGLKALGEVVGFDQLGMLIKRLLTAKTPDDTAAALAALTAASIRMPDRDAAVRQLGAAAATASREAQQTLMALMAEVGGAEALQQMAAAARSTDPEVQDTATRLLGEWMSVDAAPELMKLARTAKENKYRIRALRGYIRIARQLDLTVEQRLAMCREALAASHRDEEKRLVLDVLGRTASAPGMEILLSKLADPRLKQAACAAAVAAGEKMLAADPKAVAAAMEQVVAAGPKGDLAARAKLLLDQAREKAAKKG
jgi:HEAT repeat protein